MATIDDVVRVSGVSRSTVFRFLSGSNVRAPVRDAIQTAMKELDYFYNPRHSRSDIVLVISVKEHFEGKTAYADMVGGIMHRAEGLGLHVKLHAGNNPAVEDLKGKKKNRYVVIIIGKSDVEEEAESAVLKSLGVPHVFLNRIFADLEKSFVSVDLRCAAREAVDHLLALGYRKIGAWGRPASYRIDREKMAGYRDAFVARDISVPELSFTYEDDGEIEDILRGLFKSGTYPEAWFGLSDSHLLRLAPVLREFGLRVPDDIALVGMDDIESSRFFSPPITSVRIPFRDVGASSVDVALDLLENPSASSIRFILKHKLIVRESCGAKRA